MNQSKRPSIGCTLFFAISWNLAMLFGVLIAFGYISVDESSFSSNNPYASLLSLIPGFAIGIFFLYWALWPYYSIEEWRVRRNKIEIYRGWKFLSKNKPQQYTNCALQIHHNVGESRNAEDVSWDLMIVTVQGEKIFRRYVLFQVNRGYGDLSILQEIAAHLSRISGWKVME